MTYIYCTAEQPQLIAVTRLEKSPLNARRTAAKIGMAELKASLLSHGLMQNLVVPDKGDGMYRVFRRVVCQFGIFDPDAATGYDSN